MTVGLELRRAKDVAPGASTGNAPARILGTSTALPDHVLPQDQVTRIATSVFAGRHADFDRLLPVFTSTGIETRYSVRPAEWFSKEQSWPSRTEAFLEGATDLFERAARDAMADANVAASEIDCVVTVCSTGIATPSLEAHASKALGFRPDIQRVPVFGLGCAGGVSGLALANRLALSGDGQTVLLVAVELCTLAFRMDELTKSNLVATALFGDGAAAVVLSGKSGQSQRQEPGTRTREGSTNDNPPRPSLFLHGAREQTWPDTLGVMGWRVDPDGFGAIFSKRIPDIVTGKMPAAFEAFLGAEGVARSDIDHMTLHPGGTKVLQAYVDALEIAPDDLEIERAVLRDCGNMSAPTVLFVLDRRRRAGAWSGRHGVMAALGPGFTASFQRYEVAA